MTCLGSIMLLFRHIWGCKKLITQHARSFGVCEGKMCMGKKTNVVLSFVNFRFYRLISTLALALALALCQTVSAADYLIATCDGPGGYCTQGSHITIKYRHGGETDVGSEPYAGNYGTPQARLGYCPKRGEMAGSGCQYLNVHDVPVSKLKSGSWTWNDYIGSFTGTFTLPSKPSSSNTEYCVAAWISTFSISLGGQNWLSFGESMRYSGGESPCVGFAPPPPPPELCYVNSGQAIDVSFGQVERSSIGVNSGGSSDVPSSISISCMGTKSHSLSLSLKMTPASWSDSQIATSNKALGVALIHDGQQMRNGSSFNMTVQGSSTKSLQFSLLRDPNKNAEDISTGNFNASATLIVSEP